MKFRTSYSNFQHLGASWEGFALESVCRLLEPKATQVYFWRTHRGAEVDLFWQSGGAGYAIEFKYTDAPKRTRSMQSAMNDLRLKHLWIIYPGDLVYPISEQITATPLPDFLDNCPE